MKTVLLAGVLAGLASCSGHHPAGHPVPATAGRPGVTEIDAVDPGRVAAGETIYVPAYSSVYVTDQAQAYNLAITLSIRNTDPNQPIVVTSVRYHDHDGRLVHEYLKKPLRIAPLAAMEYFITESDTSGGYSASFLVDWVAEQAPNPPLVEAVMIGTAGSRGISFTCSGRVIADRARRAAGNGGRP
jgi:Protein of unknown function (DUF3124)